MQTHKTWSGTSPPRQTLKFKIILKFGGFIFLPAWQARKGEVDGEEEKRDPSRFILSSLSPTPFNACYAGYLLK